MDRNNKKSNISCAEAGQQGGLATLARHGTEHFQRAGIKGQVTLSNRYNTEDRSAWGRLGGRPRRPAIKLEEGK